MSNVTNLILTISCGDDKIDLINQVNSFKYQGIEMNLVSADFNKNVDTRTTWYGGTKFLEVGMYIGAFNNFPILEFLIHLKKLNWSEPEAVQVIVKGQDDEKFKIFNIDEIIA